MVIGASWGTPTGPMVKMRPRGPQLPLLGGLLTTIGLPGDWWSTGDSLREASGCTESPEIVADRQSRLGASRGRSPPAIPSLGTGTEVRRCPGTEQAAHGPEPALRDYEIFFAGAIPFEEVAITWICFHHRWKPNRNSCMNLGQD